MRIEKITADSPEARSADVVQENLDRLRELFPEAFKEGGVDFEVLRQLLGDEVDDAEEKFGLNWHGKKRARKLALTPSTGTLRPVPEGSVDWDTTQNLLIEGDNLEVLKLLQKSYAGKVKLIYIDPPYNTGKDFVYPDNFHDNIQNYLELTGQVEDGRKVSSNTEASGRFHTDWLNMMYPRLRLARNLLEKDGVIFVSIADHEVHNLRAIMDEIFGEENFIAAVIWQKVFSPKNSARHFSEDHDYVIVYARDAETWRPLLLPRTAEMESRYSNPDDDPRGPWTSGDMSARNYYGEGTYGVVSPSGRAIDGPPPGTYWRVSKRRFEELDQDGRIWWGEDGANVPRLKRFLSEVQDGRVPQTLWFYEEVGHTQEAKRELNAAVKPSLADAVFDTPKPTRLLMRILHLATPADRPSVVLDFFAGTGSTMDAVFRKNIEDGGGRRCILVQLPEPVEDRAGELAGTIADITKARIRSVGESLRQKNPDFRGDLGFRVLRLDSSNIRPWDSTPENLEQTLLDHEEHIRSDRSEEDVLYETLLKLGLDLCVPMETREVSGRAVYSIGGGVLFACLAPRMSDAEAEAVATAIGEWRRELAPAGDSTAVFRDSAFESDVAKANLVAVLEQAGIAKVRSL